MRRVATGVSALLLAITGTNAQHDADRDGDGLSDFAEVHKHRTDPDRADSDGDGVPDGDWHERREYQYTIRSVVQVMRPVTIDYLTDDHQDARVGRETDDFVELEVIHYPFTSTAEAIVADPDWRRTTAPMGAWTRPGPTADWTPVMRTQLVDALRRDGIDVQRLDDRTLVEQVSRWLCRRAKSQDSFTTFFTAFDAEGKPFVPAELAAAVKHDAASMARQWERDLSARGMFAHGTRGSCSSTSIYLNGCLRALGMPTRTVLCIPVVDANDPDERAMLDRGITHHVLHATITSAIDGLVGSWASHSFNEVFVGGRWRRLDSDHLGRDIADPRLFGLITHVATFGDWADARMPATIGHRQTLRRYDDHFGGPNPYSTRELDDAFGAHCTLPNPPYVAPEKRVTAVHWGDGPDVPDDVREWFRSRGRFGLCARVEGLPDLPVLDRFLGRVDCRATLASAGRPTLRIVLDAGAMWMRDDHALVFVPFHDDDRRAFDPNADYLFVLRNADNGTVWQHDDALAVPRRPR